MNHQSHGQIAAYSQYHAYPARDHRDPVFRRQGIPRARTSQDATRPTEREQNAASVKGIHSVRNLPARSFLKIQNLLCDSPNFDAHVRTHVPFIARHASPMKQLILDTTHSIQAAQRTERFTSKIARRIVDLADRWIILAQIAGFEYRHLCVMLTHSKSRHGHQFTRTNSDMTAVERSNSASEFDAVLVEAYRGKNNVDPSGYNIKQEFSAKLIVELGRCVHGSLVVEQIGQELGNKSLMIKIVVMKAK